MLVTRLYRFLTATTKTQLWFWLSLSLAFALFYSFLDLKLVFSGAYVVQEDARVYLSWMQRFIEPDLLAGDLSNNYFESVTPAGYAALYRLATAVGIEPLLFSKLLPVCLRLLTTGYCFRVCLQLFPIPAAGFISTLLLNQYLSLRDDLVSSTPRAFIYLLLLAFLFYLLRRAFLPFLGAIVLAGLFYPPLLLILAGISFLRLWQWQGSIPHLTPQRRERRFSIAGLGCSVLMLLPYALNTAQFGPVIAGIEAKALPAFSETGRIPFFDDDPLWFWLFGQHSGLLPNVLEHPLAAIGLCLPFLLRLPHRFSLAKRVTSQIAVLPQLIWASLGMFVAAHLLLYKLFAPARYTRYTFRVVLVLAAGIALVLILAALYRWAQQQAQPGIRRQLIALGLTALLASGLIYYPQLLKDFPHSNYLVGQAPAVYEFFRQQPEDILIASISAEADNLPTFSRRAILVGWEYAVPYHVTYDRLIRQRATDLIQAQYTQNSAELRNFIQKYGVDFFLLDRAAFTPEYVTNNPWLQQWHSMATEILAKLQQKEPPVLMQVLGKCTALDTKSLVVLQADCVAKASPS